MDACEGGAAPLKEDQAKPATLTQIRQAAIA